MHGEMGGYYEIRQTGSNRTQYRLFCLLDRDGPGLDAPSLVVLCGMSKAFRTTFSSADYATVRQHGAAYLASTPRLVAR